MFIKENTVESVGLLQMLQREVLTELQHYGGKTNLIDLQRTISSLSFLHALGTPRK